MLQSIAWRAPPLSSVQTPGFFISKPTGTDNFKSSVVTRVSRPSPTNGGPICALPQPGKASAASNKQPTKAARFELGISLLNQLGDLSREPVEGVLQRRAAIDLNMRVDEAGVAIR